jgi:type III secretion system YscQ/HrcQ family protein
MNIPSSDKPCVLTPGQIAQVRTALEIPTFTEKEVDWAWRLKKTMACAIHLFEHSWYLQFTSKVHMLSVGLQLQMRVQHVDVWVQLESTQIWPDLHQLLQSDAAHALQLAYIDAICRPTWDVLHHQTGQSVELINFQFQKPVAFHAASATVTRLGFDVYAATGDVATHGCLVLDNVVAHEIAQKAWPVLATQQAVPITGGAAQHVLIWEQTAVQLRLQLGYTTLESADVRRLTSGDTILLDQKEALLRAGANRHPICYWKWPDPSNAKHEAVTVHFFKSNPEIMTHSTDATPTESLEQVQLQVRFELAQWTATLSEIEGLQDGAILNLGQPIDGQCVSLWIEKQCIGHGRIVQVGDQLGVQVLRTTTSPH